MPFRDVAIIGGGVAGCSIAYHLAEKGLGSLIIERDAVASQASGKAWGVISPPENILLYMEGSIYLKGSMLPCVPLSGEGLRRFPILAQELKEKTALDIEYSELPIIRAVFNEEDAESIKKRALELAKDGFNIEWLEAEDVRKYAPGIAPGVLGGTYLPGHQVEPYRYTFALLQAAESKGATVKQAEALGFRCEKSRATSLILDNGEVQADVFVLAMGPWTAQATSWLGCSLPMSVLRDQCLVVQPRAELPLYRISSPLSDGVAIVPKVGGKVILGRVTHEEVDFDATPTESFKIEAMEAAIETMPALEDALLLEHRVGLEASQPSGGLPLLGRLPHFDNIYIATWLSIFGIQWSAAVGRIIADLIVTGQSDISIEPFNPGLYMTRP